MGDHRCNIKIEMEFHGVKDSCDMWLNWWTESSEYEGVDNRVIEFIQRVYNKGMEKYNQEMNKYYQELNKEEIKRKEIIQLKLLKERYPND